MSARTSPSASPSETESSSPAEISTVVWGAVSALGVLLAGIATLVALSLVSWAVDRPVGASAGSASRVGLQAWYLAHGVRLPVDWGGLSVPPLLMTSVIALFFYRSGRSAVRACQLTTWARIGECVAAMAVTYTTAAVLLTSVAYPGPRLLSLGEVALGAGLLSLLATLAGVLRESGHGARLAASLPGPSYAYLRGAAATLWTLAAMSALLVACSLVIGFSEASALTAALAPSGLGGLTGIGIGIFYLPNAMLLATALGTGAGFVIGDGSMYSLLTVNRAPLPILPLFAALPQSAGVLTWLLVLIPLCAGLVGALTMTRHLENEHRTPLNLAVGSLMASVLSAAGVLAVSLAASGVLGDGRLAEVGDKPWRTALFLLIELAIIIPAVAFFATAKALRPAAAARRDRALSVLETTAELEADDGDEVEALEPDLSARPRISSKLAMRRLARTGKFAALRQRDGDQADPEPALSSHRAPSASLSVVRRLREQQAERALTDEPSTDSKSGNDRADSKRRPAAGEDSGEKAARDPGARGEKRDSAPGATTAGAATPGATTASAVGAVARSDAATDGDGARPGGATPARPRDGKRKPATDD